MSTMKQFLCNNTETNRFSVDAEVGERALHEIYMPAFKTGIEAGAGAIMTSYNAVNGDWCSQSKFVNTECRRVYPVRCQSLHAGVSLGRSDKSRTRHGPNDHRMAHGLLQDGFL